jgi:mannose-1-phosphate guanylyltransferase
MKALVLAGGKGTRLQPVTYSIPKHMVPIVNRPFLQHLLSWLGRSDIDQVVLAVSYLSEIIQGHFREGDQFGARLEYSLEAEPLGTGGAIKYAEKLFEQTFPVINGDILTDMDVGAVVAFHRERQATATIAVTWVDDPTPYGVVETDAEGRVTAFIEKPRAEDVTSHYINAGVYIFEPSLFDRMPVGRAFSVERELFPQLLAEGIPVYACPTTGYWLDLGTPQKYLQAHFDILAGRMQVEMPGANHDGVWLGTDASASSESWLAAPAVLGDGVTVAEKCVVGPNAVLGDGVTMDPSATVEASVVWAGTRIGAGARVRGSIIGRDCVIEPNTVLEGQVIPDGQVISS